jgi:ornithine cyclodeaminase/alanine dehydrogenase-like protein (mu-crystallin family)
MSEPAAPLPYLDGAAIHRALAPAQAVAAVEAALRGGLDPAAGVPRTRADLANGQLLLMPAESATHAGVKLAAVAPANPARGLPLISAVYVLFDAETLRPAALLDGTALTTLRTPAVSVAAVRPFLPPRPLRVVVLGAGPQGAGHLGTLAAVADVAEAHVVARTPGTALAAFPGVPPHRVLTAGTPEVTAALQAADVVVCATTAREPVFDSTLLAGHAVVVAVGSYEPDVREVDAAFCARATVVAEDVATALRECGEIVLAVAEGALDPWALVPMRDVVRGEHPARRPAGTGPVLYKGSGMSWQDLVVAEAVLAGSPGV